MSESNTFLSVDEARTRICSQITPITRSESVSLEQALGRVLSNDVVSPIDVPGYRNSAMDGYAVNGTQLINERTTSFNVIGNSFAGVPFDGAVGVGEAVRIMTGALVPEGTDTVIMQEQVDRNDDRITILGEHHIGDNVRHPGEDMAAGETVLMAGTVIDPAELGLLASLGIGSVAVQAPPRIALLSTGDELVEPGQTLAEGQLFDSNRFTLRAMLQRLGYEIEDMGIIADDKATITEAFRTAAANADAIITSGGVSVGDADFVKQVLEEIGEIDFWKIAMKPGKPLAFGNIDGTRFFGLPGNPVSVMVTFQQMVRPALARLAGATSVLPTRMTLPCANRLKKRPGRADFQRGQLEHDEQGNLQVRSVGAQGSHLLTTMSRADCFIILPAESGDLEAGTMVNIELFDHSF